MIVKCSRVQLSEALQEMISVVPSSSMIPVLNHILFRLGQDTIEMTGSDLEISLVTRLSCSSAGEMKTAIPAKLFADIVKSMTEDELSLEFEENSLHIVGQNNRFFINCMDSAEFPSLPQVEGTSYAIHGQEMLNLFKKVNAAISAKGEGNISFSSVLMQTFANELRLVTTDGQRLMIAKHWEKVDLNSMHLLIPPKTFQVLAKMIGKNTETVQFTVGDRELSVQCENKILISRILEGNFPDYERVIPSSVSYRFEVKTHDFMQSLQRLNLLVRNTSKRVNFKVMENNLILSASDPELGSGEESLNVVSSGGEFEAVFDVRKLMEGVEGIESEEMTMETAGPLHPIIMKEKDSDKYLYLIVSLRKP
jgi:DNA polymerase III subunit beta